MLTALLVLQAIAVCTSVYAFLTGKDSIEPIWSLIVAILLWPGYITMAFWRLANEVMGRYTFRDIEGLIAFLVGPAILDAYLVACATRQGTW